MKALRKPAAWLAVLLVLSPWASAQEIDLPGGLQGDGIDRAMPELARDAIARYREDDRARFLDTLFRLQLAAGRL